MSNNKDNFVSSPVELEEQEHLTAERLNILKPVMSLGQLETDRRPKENFLDLMNWVEKDFGRCLLYTKLYTRNKLVHNRIVIDGQFMQFCQEKKAKVETLYKDSIVSWKTENGYEKFFSQGVFRISCGKFEFLSAALFHKGNQNEDEISFFVIVGEEHHAEYVAFRNEFDAWVVRRDRSNLHVKVIDGADMPYSRDNSWADLFLPEAVKKDIKFSVENFLSNKDFYLKNKIPWKIGMLFYGAPGCGKSSIIKTIIANYDFKPITIAPGASNETLYEAFSYAEEQSPSLLYFEDLDSLLETTLDLSTLLNLLDGISAKNGLLIMATANDILKLKPSITDRPSRFDRKFEIPLPDVQMSSLYLKKWFGSMLSDKQAKDLATHAYAHKFSYAYLKELYISSMFEALANNRKAPIAKDISKSLDRLMKDKNIIRSGRSINTDKYFSK